MELFTVLASLCAIHSSSIDPRIIDRLQMKCQAELAACVEDQINHYTPEKMALTKCLLIRSNIVKKSEQSSIPYTPKSSSQARVAN